MGVVHRLLARQLAALAGLRNALCATGAVTIMQRFGSAANLNVHFHCLAVYGVYRVGRDRRPGFVAATAPTQSQLQSLLAAMIARLIRLFVRGGVVVAKADRAWVAALVLRTRPHLLRFHGIRAPDPKPRALDASRAVWSIYDVTELREVPRHRHTAKLRCATSWLPPSRATTPIPG